MEIAVYMSDAFANEDTKLYKSTKAHYKMIGERKNVKRGFQDIDKSSSTTLAELYADGWKISQVVSKFDIVYIFFMERS